MLKELKIKKIEIDIAKSVIGQFVTRIYTNNSELLSELTGMKIAYHGNDYTYFTFKNVNFANQKIKDIKIKVEEYNADFRRIMRHPYFYSRNEELNND